MRRVTLPNAILLGEAVAMLNNQHTVSLRAKGNSMLPFIVGGRDSVVLQQTRSTLHRGDIALAEPTPGNYVLHRVMATSGDQVTLMGDGNLIQREQCPLKQIHAVVVTIIRNEKYISCDSRAERWKAHLWMASLPIRRYLLTAYKRFINKQPDKQITR